MDTMKENYSLMFINYPDVVNIQQLRGMLDIGSTLAYQLVKEGKIPSLKVGRAYKIPKAYVISYLTSKSLC